MNYLQDEISPLKEENFITGFMGVINAGDIMIDVLTVVHHSLSFDEAEKNQLIFEVIPGTMMKIVPYDFLKEMNLFAHRDKDLFDIARLKELRNLKK